MYLAISIALAVLLFILFHFGGWMFLFIALQILGWSAVLWGAFFLASKPGPGSKKRAGKLIGVAIAATLLLNVGYYFIHRSTENDEEKTVASETTHPPFQFRHIRVDVVADTGNFGKNYIFSSEFGSCYKIDWTAKDVRASYVTGTQIDTVTITPGLPTVHLSHTDIRSLSFQALGNRPLIIGLDIYPDTLKPGCTWKQWSAPMSVDSLPQTPKDPPVEKDTTNTLPDLPKTPHLSIPRSQIVTSVFSHKKSRSGGI